MEHRWFWSVFLVVINVWSLALSEVQQAGCCGGGSWVPNSFSIPGASLVVTEKLKNVTKSSIVSKPLDFRPSPVDKGLNGGYESDGWAGFNGGYPGYPGYRKFPNTQRSSGDGSRSTYVTHTHYYSYIFPSDNTHPDIAKGINNDTLGEGSGSDVAVKDMGKNGTEVINDSDGDGKHGTKAADEDDLSAEDSKGVRGYEPERDGDEDAEDNEDVEVFDTKAVIGRNRNGGSHHIELFGEILTGPPKGRGRRDGNVKSGNSGSNSSRPEKVGGRSRAGSSKESRGSGEVRTGSSKESRGSGEVRTGSSKESRGSVEGRAGSSKELRGSAGGRTGSSKESRGNVEVGAKSEPRNIQEAIVNKESNAKSGTVSFEGSVGRTGVIGKIIAVTPNVEKIPPKGIVRTLTGNLNLVGPSAPIFGRIVIESPRGGRGVPVIGRIVVENPDDGREVEPTNFGADGPFDNPSYQGSAGAFGNTIGGSGIGYASSNYNIHVFNQNYAPGGYAVSDGGYRFDPQAPLFPPPVPITGRQFLRQVWRAWVRRVLLGGRVQ